MATVQTFGADSDRVLALAPMLLIGDGTGTLITTARSTALLNAAGARICAILEASFGAGTSADIAALGATSIQYLACQRLVAMAALPGFLRAAAHPSAIDSQIVNMLAENEEEIRFFTDKPAAAIGRVSDTSRIDQIRTSTAELDLDTDTASLRARREFDGRSSELGVDEHGYAY